MRGFVLASAIVVALAVLPVPPAAAASHSVTANNFSWSPTPLTIAPGDSVTFLQGTGTHTLQSSFKNCGTLGPGCVHTFSTAATFTYICGIHPSMAGSIVVSGPPPTVAFTSPASGATVSGTIAVAGTATPPSGATITKVEIKVDAGGTYSTATGTTSWTRQLDTTTLTNGGHTLFAKATTNHGGVAEVSRSITVQNAATRDLQPTAMASSPVGLTSTQAFVSVTVRNNANSPSGVFHLKLEYVYDGGRQPAGGINFPTIGGFAQSTQTTVVGDLFHYGRFDVVATADDLGQVTETNEANNAFTGSVPLVTGAFAGQDLRDPHT